MKTLLVSLIGLACVASCSKDGGSSSSALFCVEDGFKCTGVDEFTSCARKCESSSDCKSKCSAYQKCTDKCNCDNLQSCTAGCASELTTECQTCVTEELNPCQSQCPTPTCTQGSSGDGGTIVLPDSGSNIRLDFGGTGGATDCDTVGRDCCPTQSGQDKSDCEAAVNSGNEQLCAIAALAYCP